MRLYFIYVTSRYLHTYRFVASKLQKKVSTDVNNLYHEDSCCKASYSLTSHSEARHQKKISDESISSPLFFIVFLFHVALSVTKFTVTLQLSFNCLSLQLLSIFVRTYVWMIMSTISWVHFCYFFLFFCCCKNITRSFWMNCNEIGYVLWHKKVDTWTDWIHCKNNFNETHQKNVVLNIFSLEFLCKNL